MKKTKNCCSAAKRKRRNPSKFGELKHCRRMELEDRSSGLPDDILLHILSPLTLKEAAATSILSKRWRYLWTYLPGLDFGNPQALQRMSERSFIQMVNQALRLYKGPDLHYFKVCFALAEKSSFHINSWIAFVVAKRVSRLELDFSGYNYYRRIDSSNMYSIPPKFFAKTMGMEAYLKQFDCAPSVLTSSLALQNCFETLRELFLKSVDITDEVFETILSSCSSLEHLYLKDNHKLVNARRTVPHPKLKRLEMYCCYGLKNLEISTPNLVVFQFRGESTTSIRIKDAQQLVNMTILAIFGDSEYLPPSSLGLDYLGRKSFVFGQFAACLSQLEYLGMNVFKGKKPFSRIPVFNRLKHLRLFGFYCHLPLCYLAAANLIKASPVLHRFELHLPGVYPWITPKVRMIPMSPHQNLKEVLLSGFKGETTNMDFVTYILNHTVALEKIEITTAVALVSEDCPNYYENDVDVAKKCAQQLGQIVPPNIQLKFLDIIC